MSLVRNACHSMAAVIAMTGLPSQRSASSANRVITKSVPTCTMASTPASQSSYRAVRMVTSSTAAIASVFGLFARPPHAQLSMRGVISSTGSCQVKLTTPYTALTLEHTCWHDQGRTHKGKNDFLCLKMLPRTVSAAPSGLTESE